MGDLRVGGVEFCEFARPDLANLYRGVLVGGREGRGGEEETYTAFEEPGFETLELFLLAVQGNTLLWLIGRQWAG